MSYVRVSILGTLTGGEVWSVNPVFDPTGEIGTGVNQAALDAATLAIANRTIPTTLRTIMGAACIRTGARVEVRDDVSDALIAISIQSSTTPAAGSSPIRLPFQAATVISLRTNTPGASGRGRLYWPALAATLGTDGKIITPAPATLVSDARAYLTGIETDLEAGAFGGSFDLAVRSKTTKTTPHVVRLQVGDLVDTQRRRRDALPEAYSQVNYPT